MILDSLISKSSVIFSSTFVKTEIALSGCNFINCSLARTLAGQCVMLHLFAVL